jgi:hypothetical protein
MHQVLKIFFLAVLLMVAAFFANYFGYISIPWMEINAVPTYGGEVKASDEAVKQVLVDETANKTE